MADSVSLHILDRLSDECNLYSFYIPVTFAIFFYDLMKRCSQKVWCIVVLVSDILLAVNGPLSVFFLSLADVVLPITSY